MDGRSILIAQSTALVESLESAKATINHEKINSELRQKVYGRFSGQIDRQLQKLRQEVELVDNGQSLALAWNVFRQNRKDCNELLNECFGFLEGALLRSSGLDLGICKIADAIVDRLSDYTYPWNRFVIVAEESFFADMTEIIRLQFPEFTIWNLPIIGHEFGHFVGRQLRNSIKPDLFKMIVNAEGKRDLNSQDETFLYEQFADLFATYALGPAFACTSLFLAFKPAKDTDGREHPSDAKRAYFILQTLERMNGKEDLSPYRNIIERLSESWQKNQEAAGVITPLLPETISMLQGRLNHLYHALDENLLGVKYSADGWHQICVLADGFLEKSVGELVEELVTHENALPDILNIAWVCRILNWRKPYLTEQINQKALKLSQEIIQRKSSKR